MSKKPKTLIGRAERIDFPVAKILGVPAKIDTGAYRSSVWASDIEERDGKLFFKLLGPESPFYTGKELSVHDYEIVEVENSFGHAEERYSIMLSMRLGGRRVRTNITLSDRSKKTYPVLVGRKILRGKFIVDVSQGEPLPDEESSES